ncbi:hypothetical protein QYF36_020643 [Acer negundo]|nr:hypothetical protein QYF36_020643 [Acer negundo]
MMVRWRRRIEDDVVMVERRRRIDDERRRIEDDNNRRTYGVNKAEKRPREERSSDGEYKEGRRREMNVAMGNHRGNRSSTEVVKDNRLNQCDRKAEKNDGQIEELMTLILDKRVTERELLSLNFELASKELFLSSDTEESWQPKSGDKIEKKSIEKWDNFKSWKEVRKTSKKDDKVSLSKLRSDNLKGGTKDKEKQNVC